jgi:hypothetical protein
MPDPQEILYLSFLVLMIPHAIFTAQLIAARRQGAVLLLFLGGGCLAFTILAPMDSAPDGFFVGLNALAVVLSMSGAIVGMTQTRGFKQKLGVSSVLFSTVVGALLFAPWSELQFNKQQQNKAQQSRPLNAAAVR